MSPIKIICPLNAALINRFKDREISVRVDDPALIPSVRQIVEESGNRLMCVILDSTKAVDEIQFNEEWRSIPIALMAASLGKFYTVVKSARLLRTLNLRIFLPYSAENLKGVRILASIGIPCCIILEDAEMDWGGLADLMTYAVLERVPHASIEPFTYILKHYEPNAYAEWGTPYFEDPAQFIHLDSTGRVAPSRRALLDKKFIGHIDDLDTAINALMVDKTKSRRKLFIENHPCSRCPSFRVCSGRVKRDGTNLSGCSGFFSEMEEAVELHRAQKTAAEGRPVWQL